MIFNGKEKGISPVVGTILLVAVTVIIAGSIAAFVYGFSTTQEEPKISGYQFLGLEDSDNLFTVSHGGGDSIPNAFDGDQWGSNLKLTVNGEEITENIHPSVDTDPDFDVGEEVTVELSEDLKSGDAVKFIYVPTNSVLADIELQ